MWVARDKINAKDLNQLLQRDALEAYVALVTIASEAKGQVSFKKDVVVAKERRSWLRQMLKSKGLTTSFHSLSENNLRVTVTGVPDPKLLKVALDSYTQLIEVYQTIANGHISQEFTFEKEKGLFHVYSSHLDNIVHEWNDENDAYLRLCTDEMKAMFQLLGWSKIAISWIYHGDSLAIFLPLAG